MGYLFKISMWYNAGNERPHAQNFCKINELGIIFENCDLSVTLTGFQCMMSYFFSRYKAEIIHFWHGIRVLSGTSESL